MDTLNFVLNKLNISLDGQKRMPISLPGFTRNDLAKLFNDLGYTRGVEIGVENGFYSEILCQSNPKLHLYSIDPFQTYPTSGLNTQDKQEVYYRRALARLSKYSCELLRLYSDVAVNLFEDRSLDFVYIDGNHFFPHVAADLYNWSKKVKIGGILSGHDYWQKRHWAESHVVPVVNAFTTVYEIHPWFLTDRIPEMGRHDRPTFFWVVQPWRDDERNPFWSKR